MREEYIHNLIMSLNMHSLKRWPMIVFLKRKERSFTTGLEEL